MFDFICNNALTCWSRFVPFDALSQPLKPPPNRPSTKFFVQKETLRRLWPSSFNLHSSTESIQFLPQESSSYRTTSTPSVIPFLLGDLITPSWLSALVYYSMLGMNFHTHVAPTVCPSSVTMWRLSTHHVAMLECWNLSNTTLFKSFSMHFNIISTYKSIVVSTSEFKSNRTKKKWSLFDLLSKLQN